MQFSRRILGKAILTVAACTALHSAHAVLVYEGAINLSGATATQTSTLADYNANLAIDGDINNFTHTDVSDTNPTWSLALPSNVDFNMVRIYNRSSCCGDRLRDITVSVFDDPSASHQVYTSGLLNPANVLNSPSKLDVNLSGTVTGQVVQIRRTPEGNADNNQSVLSLGEVRLFSGVHESSLAAGTDLTHANLLNMTVGQSSTYGGYPAQNGVDGNTGTFTHTNTPDSSASWFVNFGENMLLESVDLHNREGCCPDRLRDITVQIRDANGNVVFTSALLNPENSLDGPSDLTLDLLALNNGSAILGQTLTVFRTSDPDWSGLNSQNGIQDDANVLSMGEVYVFGATVPEPTTAVLLVFGVAAVTLRRRRVA